MQTPVLIFPLNFLENCTKSKFKKDRYRWMSPKMNTYIKNQIFLFCFRSKACFILVPMLKTQINASHAKIIAEIHFTLKYHKR